MDSATCSSAGNALDSERIWDLLQDVRASDVQPDIGPTRPFWELVTTMVAGRAALGVLRSMAMDGVQARM